MFYRRRLPHWIPTDAIVAVRWRLAGSLPGQPGPLWLKDPGIANMLVGALEYGESTRRFYDLYAYVVMPNHVHAVLQPLVPLPKITQWLKGRTSRVANRMLGRTGAFWQDESFDHWIRNREELREIIRYTEEDPVRAGLVESISNRPWSSARSAT